MTLSPNRGLAVCVMTNANFDSQVSALSPDIEAVILERLDDGQDVLNKQHQKPQASLFTVAEQMFPMAFRAYSAIQQSR